MGHWSTSPAGESSDSGPLPYDSSLPGEGRTPDPERPTREAEERGVLAENLLLDQLGRCALPLALVFAMGVARGFQAGFGSVGALVLLIGAPVSGVATFLYALPTALLSYGHRKKPWMPLAVIGGIVAYAFGLFLILVLGLWDQVRAPSLAGAGRGLFFLLTGFWFLRGLGRVAELARRIDRTLSSEARLAQP